MLGSRSSVAVGGALTLPRTRSGYRAKGLSRYRVQSYAIAFVLYLFALERALTQAIPASGYIDELFFIVAVPVVVYRFKRLSTLERYSFLCCLAVLFFGLTSNIWSGLLAVPIAIATDVISCFKVIIAYFLFKALYPEDEVVNEALDLSARVGRLLVVVMLATLVVSQFVDIGMSAGARYGVNSFMFTFGHPGNFSKLFYFLVPLLFLDLRNGSTPWKIATIALSLVVWCFTMRSRAIVFAGLTVLITVYYFSGYRKRMGIRFGAIGFLAIVFGVAMALALVGDKIALYFGTDTQARYNLVKYAFVTAENYFPFGSGFGTYGSHVAAEYYSPLYNDYGFSHIYGMSPQTTMYLDDNYWPMILGQFGFVGLVFMGAALVLVFVQCFRDVGHSHYEWFAMLLLIGFLLLSSVASKSYSEFSSICCFMLMALIRPWPNGDTQAAGDGDDGGDGAEADADDELLVCIGGN